MAEEIKLQAESIQTPYSPRSSCGITEIVFRNGELIIEIRSDIGTATVHFEFAYGHRVLDEQDLGEFWPTCSLPNGWLYQIFKGGWLQLEATRPLCFVAGTKKDLLEFFVVSENTCVNVLAYKFPTIRTSHPA